MWQPARIEPSPLRKKAVSASFGVLKAMSVSHPLINLLLLVPVAIAVIYYDVRFRRIPNTLVLMTLLTGLAVSTLYDGMHGFVGSVIGCLLAFIPMFLIHLFGAMGAGDVKLFAAIGSVIGVNLILPAFVFVALLGGMLAIYCMMRDGTVFSTMHGVVRIFAGLLPGWELPRFSMPPDRRHTIPYGVAIMLGSLLVTFVYHA